MPYPLNSSQKSILATILARGRAANASPMELKSAIETAIVESGITNSGEMTDHDSQGWRQERKSLYPDPTNVSHSADRYFSEARALRGKYDTAGELAANVQRPAAQYRGRYQQDSSQADQILQQLGVTFGGAPAPATRGHATTRTASPATQQTTTTTTEAPTTGLASLLSSFQSQQKPVMASMGVQAPSFSADRYGSSGQVPVSPQAAPPKTDYGSLIAQAAQVPATTTTQKTVTGENAAVAGATAVTPPKAKPKSGSGSAAVQFASDHLGAYAESQGQNVGPQLNTLEQKFGLTGQPWCAMFATTAAAHGGASRAVRTASVADINQWASQGSHGYQKGLYKTSQARAGDLITFGSDHVGLVTGVDAQGNVHTIEGNTRANRVSTSVHPPNSGTIVKPRYQ